MPTKQKILDNVAEYSAEQLVEYVQQDIVTFDELVKDTDGEFDAVKRKKVKELLDNADELAWEKVQNEKTIEVAQWYLDTFPGGAYRSKVRSIKAEIEKQKEDEYIQTTTDDAWTLVDKDNINSLREFINAYPQSNYINKAKDLIDRLLYEEIMDENVDALVCEINNIQTSTSETKDREAKDDLTIDIISEYLKSEKITKQELLGKLSEDHNFLSSGVIKRLIWEENLISTEDLLSINIDRAFIQRMFRGDPPHTFPTPEKLIKINKQSTEIYFWGIPSSGKSCALGAILSVAASGRIAKTMDPDTESQGYGYMTKLINLFQDGKMGTLMEGTSPTSFYEMGFDLIDEDKRHPITCIDMAGELMRCMYKDKARDELDTIQRGMLDTLHNVLIGNRSRNRKIHIFVIEYGAEERLYEGLPQKVWLDGVVSYIKNTKIFEKDTDAIYIMITKTDKIKDDNKQKIINQYINENYLGFYNGLEQICKENEINKGRVEKIAFSLGEVCFQNYCKFNAKPAENVVKIMLQRSASYRNGKRGWFEGILKG